LVRVRVEEIMRENMSIVLQSREVYGQSEQQKWKMDRPYTVPMGFECFKLIAAIDINAC
jgi:hypothetical protein